jgi:Cu-Zn family superoxide dismutase
MRLPAILPLGAAIALAACATPARHSPVTTLAIAPVVTATGTTAGSVSLQTGGAGSLVLTVALHGLPPGLHGIHLHMIGQCSGPAFTSAGGHLNPGQHQHGTDNPAGSHLGDLPNLTIAPDGTASTELSINSSEAALTANLFDADGTAVVIHASADDYKTDPSGNSGARIACGIFQHP